MARTLIANPPSRSEHYVTFERPGQNTPENLKRKRFIGGQWPPAPPALPAPGSRKPSLDDYDRQRDL